jgi:hypothetical protein
MGYIYRSATEVLVYLGDCIDRCEQTNVSQEPIPIIFHGNGCDSDNLDIFRLHSSDMKVRRLIKNIHSSHGCDFEVFCLIRMLAGHNHVTELLAKDTDLNVKGRITGLYELMRRLMHSLWSPWWNRIWVVQENCGVTPSHNDIWKSLCTPDYVCKGCFKFTQTMSTPVVQRWLVQSHATVGKYLSSSANAFGALRHCDRLAFTPIPGPISVSFHK